MHAQLPFDIPAARRLIARMRSRLPPNAASCLVVILFGSSPAFPADPPNGLSGTFSESSGSPQVIPSSGAMSYAVPFDLPQGRGNSQLSLAIQYRSGAPTGEAGLGWSLTLPQIERAPLSGWPKYVDNGDAQAEDRYVFNGQPLTFICVVGGSPRVR